MRETESNCSPEPQVGREKERILIRELKHLSEGKNLQSHKSNRTATHPFSPPLKSSFLMLSLLARAHHFMKPLSNQPSPTQSTPFHVT